MAQYETNNPLELINQKIEQNQAVAKHHQSLVKQHQSIVEHHLAVVIDLKIERNRLAPVSKIPPEVLYKIFFMASRDIRRPGVDWIALTYVCYDWRHLALTSPSLWSNPPFQEPCWAKEMLIRSEPTNLTIQADGELFEDYHCSYSLVKVLETRMARIKCINLEFPLRAENLLEHLPKSAPNLESLTLRCQSWCSDEPVAIQKGSLCALGRLKQIDLSAICIDWDVHLPSSLTSLKLTRIHDSYVPTMAQVWNTLERMPLLETLELLDALPMSETPISSNTTIRLDRLHKLTLRTGIAETECFLQTITFPPSAIIDIDCYQASLTGYLNSHEIIRLLGQSLHDCTERIQSLQIGYCSHTFIRMRVPVSSSNKGPMQGLPKHPYFGLQVGWNRGADGHTNIAEKIFIDIFRHFPFDLVKDVRLENSTSKFSPATLLHTVGSLPLLQKMQVCLGPYMLDAMQSRLAVSEKTATPCLSFPSLRQIIISETGFYDDPEYHTGVICFKDLVDCLTWRKQHGAAVTKLDLKSCYEVTQDKVDRLKDSVSEVKWERQLKEYW